MIHLSRYLAWPNILYGKIMAKYLPGESGQNCIHINLICYGILINLNKFGQISGLSINLVSGKVLDQRFGKIKGQKLRGRISDSKQYQKNAIHFWFYKKFKHLDRYPAINFAQYSFKNYWPNTNISRPDIWPNVLVFFQIFFLNQGSWKKFNRFGQISGLTWYLVSGNILYQIFGKIFVRLCFGRISDRNNIPNNRIYYRLILYKSHTFSQISGHKFCWIFVQEFLPDTNNRSGWISGRIY